MASVKPPPYGDRIQDTLLFQAEQEAIQRARNPLLRRDDSYLLGLRRDEYQSILDSYGNPRHLNRGERASRVYLRDQLRKLDAKIQPTLLNRLRYSAPVDTLIKWFQGRAARTAGYNRLIRQADNQTTQEKNVNRLSEEMKNTGFTVSLEAPLKKLVAQGRDSFHLPYAASNDAKTDYTLFFKKLPGTETYYLESFDAATKPTIAEALRSDGRVIRQRFSLLDEPSFTAQQAANVIHQKPVAKIVRGEERWATLDAGGQLILVPFDIEKELSRHSIKELNNPNQQDALLAGLKNGTVREVTLIGPKNQSTKVMVQVDPLAQGLLFKDRDNRVIDPTRLFYRNPNVEKMLTMTQDQTPVFKIHPGIRG